MRLTLPCSLLALALATGSAVAGRAVPAMRDAPILREQAGPTVLRPVKLSFGCVVGGTPVEFPNDIAISNNYGFATPAGIQVAYSAPFGNSGVVTLPSLAPGATYYVSNAVPGGHPPGAPCSASQI